MAFRERLDTHNYRTELTRALTAEADFTVLDDGSIIRVIHPNLVLLGRCWTMVLSPE